MKKINLSKELLLNGVLIGVISIGLASCGGGGGGGSTHRHPHHRHLHHHGGSSSSTPTSPGGISPSPPLSYSLATYLYAGTDYYNEPIITVYIDGQRVKLLADTGSSGLVVNDTAVNIPYSDIYSSYSLLSGPGVMASATVCLNPSITNSCVVMPIGLVSPYYSTFSSTGEAQGDFGLASGLNSLDIGYNSSGSSITGYSYPYYLEKQSGSINSYTISFYSLSNGYYSNVSSTTPIGQIIFGVYNGNSNTLIPYTIVDLYGDTNTTVVFSSSTTSFTGYAVFDSGANDNYLTTNVFQTEIPNFSQTADENACASYTNYGSGIVNGGFVISYSLQNNSGSFYRSSFTTEPSSGFCQAGNPFTLMEGITFDDGTGSSYETFGLPAMLGHTFTWVLGTSGTNQGFVQDIGISP